MELGDFGATGGCGGNGSALCGGASALGLTDDTGGTGVPGGSDKPEDASINVGGDRAGRRGGGFTSPPVCTCGAGCLDSGWVSVLTGTAAGIGLERGASPNHGSGVGSEPFGGGQLGGFGCPLFPLLLALP